METLKANLKIGLSIPNPDPKMKLLFCNLAVAICLIVAMKGPLARVSDAYDVHLFANDDSFPYKE